MFVGMLGVDFEVREPPELAEYLRVVGERLTRAADREPADRGPGYRTSGRPADRGPGGGEPADRGPETAAG
jgi:hypothetical protein